MAAGIQQNKQNTHKSMSTVGTIVYNSDLFSDINTINMMAAALYFHEQQKVWCVMAMEQGKTFVEVCQEFWVKYDNDINGILCEIQGKEYVMRFYKFMKCGFRFLGCSRNFLARFFNCFLVSNQLCGFVLIS